ncbi:MAG: alpha/beta hydrolase [Candidatus Thiodiazotropha sp. 6PLUC9]
MKSNQQKQPTGNPFSSHKFPLKVRLFFAVTRFFFSALGSIAPTLAGKLALPLFMTPPRFPSPRREMAIKEKGKQHYKTIDGNRIAIYTWGEGPAVLLSHGWGGRSTHFYALIELLVSAGYQVVAFDAPAHGESSGKRTNALDVTSALVAVAGSLDSIKVLIGHSFGCGTALLAIDGFEIKVEKLILFSCFEDIYWITNQFGEAFAMNEKVTAAMRDEAHRRYLNRFDKPWEWHQLSPINTIQRIKTEILMLHDQQDQEVPYQHAENLIAVSADAQLVTTSGLGHKKILRDKAVLQTCLDFIQKQS